MLASNGPERMLAEFSGAERPDPDSKPGGGLAVPPRRIAGTYAAVFSGEVRDDAARCWGPCFWPPTSGSVMTFLGDTHGLGDHGEVLVGWKSGDRIHLPLRLAAITT